MKYKLIIGRIKKNALFMFLILVNIVRLSYADITTDSFSAWPSPMGSVGIENFQHDKFTGSVVYSIPLEVAPGTNGIQPRLVLRYFSGNGNSSVGNGWSIDLGRITRSTRLRRPNFNDNDIFVLQLNDIVSELVNIGGGQFRTKLESYLRITKAGGTWLVEDKDGTKYAYGYNVGDLNYYLTKVTDAHGNYLELSYFSSDNVGYIDRIAYTKGNGLSKFRTIEFFYEDRSDNYPDNSTGKTVKYNKRVDYINIKVDDQLYKRYDFSYNYSPNSGKSLIAQIDEVSRDGNLRLLLAKFTYVVNSINFSSAKSLANPLLIPLSDRYTRVGDVNGDGFPDLFRIKSGFAEVCLGNGQYWGSIVKYSFSYGFDTYGSNVRLGDVNGDGRDDIIKSASDGYSAPKYYVSYNNGTGWAAPVLISDTDSLSIWPSYMSLLFSTTHLAYVNNDKYIDIVSGRLINWNVVYEVAYGKGNGWDAPRVIFNSLPTNFILSPYVYNNVGSNTILTDINGDGLADIVSSARGTSDFHFYYILANGTSWDGTVRELAVSDYFDLRWSSTKFFDVNKDGFQDLVSGRYYNNNLGYKYLLGNGKGFSQERQLNSFPSCSTGDRGVLVTDADSDGIADVVNGDSGQYYSCRIDVPQDDLLKEIINRYGGKITFVYKSPKEAGNTTFPFSLAVLASTIYEPGVSASPSGTARYYYESGQYDSANRIFRGFGHVQITDPLNYVSHMYFHQDDSRLGKIERQENSITKTINTYKQDSSPPYFTPLAQVDEYTDYKCRRIAYDYDAYGNIIKATYYGDIDAAGDEKSIFTDYALNTSLWLVNLPSRQRIFANTDGSGLVVFEIQYFYDNNANYSDVPTKGDLTKVKRYLNTITDYISANSTYDIYGNEVTKTDAKGNTTIIGYDATYYTFPVTVTNAEGHIERVTYYMPIDTKGLFGQIKSRIDVNGNETTFEYDGFGRKTKATGPYDSSSTYGSESYEYGINGPGANYVLTRTTEESGTSNHFMKIDILDGFERVIQSARESEDPNIFSYITTNYNPRGETAKVSLPYFKDGGLKTSYLSPDGSIKWTQYSYDAIGRITAITKPDTGTINNYYSGWTTTVTDENSHQKTFVNNAYGRLINVKEKNAAEEYNTYYNYDALDNLTRITDHFSNKFEFFYDSLKRRIKMIDPDLGTWNYEYDNNGNLTKITDGNGEITNFTYDQLNRLASKDYTGQAGVEAAYKYDEPTSANGIGRRTSMQDLSGNSRWEYDKEGRITKLEKTVGGAIYKLEWTYDAMDRVKSILFPNLKRVDFRYNNAGLTESIDGFILNTDYNASYQPVTVTFSNPIFTKFEYYPENYRLKSIFTGAMQNLNYEYDKVGNITKIIDTVRSNTKQYTYDDLDRLLLGDSNSYEYNPIGNIIKFNGVTQSYSLSKIHALINDGTSSYSYDSCGNMLIGGGLNISYDSENRPVRITKNGTVTQFVYDGDGRRVKKIVTNGSLTTTTVYIEDFYEKETIQ